jgi:hypothetical protein
MPLPLYPRLKDPVPIVQEAGWAPCKHRPTEKVVCDYYTDRIVDRDSVVGTEICYGLDRREIEFR